MPDMKATLGLDRSAFDTGLAMAEKNVAGFASKIGHLMVGAFAIHEVISTFKESIEKLDRVAKLSRVFDVPTETLQRLGGVAQLSGGNIDDVAKALGKMSKAAFTAKQDGGALVAAFEAVGVSLDDLNHMETQELFIKIADGLNKIENPVTRAGIGMQIFGKGFITIAPMIAEGGAAIQKLASTMNIASDEAVMSSEKISDTFKQLQITVQELMGTFAVAANPIIQFASIGVEQMLTFANSISMVISAQRELKNVFADVSKDQAELKNRQTDRVLMGASDKELKKELEKLTVPQEIPDQFSAQQRELRQKIMSELERRKNVKSNRNDDAEDIVGKNVKKTEEAFAESEKAAAKHELRLIEAEILGKEQAEKMKAEIEERYRQRSLDREIEMEKKKNEQKLRLQDLLAKEGGPQAEMGLLESRAKDAAKAFQDMPSTDTATALAEARGALKDALVQQIKDQPGVQPKGFAESEAQRKLVAKGLGADLSGFAQKSEQFRPLEKLPDMANQLVAASKTLDQILEEIRKGDGSVFR